MNSPTQTLKTLLATIRAEEGIAKIELEHHPVQSRAGMEMRKRQAQQALEGLYNTYRSLVGRQAVALYLTGPEEAQAAFAGIAKGLGAVTLDSKAFYLDVTKDALASMGISGRVTPTEIAHIMHGIRTVAYDELKLQEFERPNFTPLMAKFVHPKGLANDVQAAVVASDGHRMAAIYLGHLAAKECLASGYIQDVVAVIVTGASKSEIEALSASGQFTGRPSSIVVLDDGKVTEQFVRDTLAQHTGLSYAVPETAAKAEPAEEKPEPVAVKHDNKKKPTKK